MTEELPEVRYSEIKRFKRCRRSWMNGYFLGLRQPEFSGEHAPKLKRDAGTLVHRDLEAYYNGETSAPGEYLRTAERVTSDNPEYAADWVATYALAQIMLDGFGEWLEEEGHDVGEETWGTEVEVKYRVDTEEGPCLLVCHIDRIVKDTLFDRIIIDDTKTVDTLEKGGQFAVEEQLLTYALVASGDPERGGLGLTVSECRHTMLRRVKRTARAKPPFYGRESIYPSTDQIHSTFLSTQAVLTEILQARQNLAAGLPHQAVAYPNSHRDCSWDCDFLPICQAHDEPDTDLDGLRQALYIKRDAAP